ncbi:MAG: 4-hydroxy-3-methylbut-2-enyl diphosphate reductase, partial [candidate division WOR-3 bacterium]
IIHNPQVVEELKSKGVMPAFSVSDIPEGSIVAIRSHGVTIEELEAIKKRGARIIDATCPFVKRAQNIVLELAKSGYGILIVGERDHPEVRALVSYGLGKASVYPDIPDEPKIGIVAQTTQILDSYREVVVEVLKRLVDVEEIRVFNTICRSTEERQKEARKIAEVADVVIVVGGKNSANTRRLYEIVAERNVPVYHIETENDIEPSWFFGKEVVGITGGASTPEEIIERVVERVKNIVGGCFNGRE